MSLPQTVHDTITDKTATRKKIYVEGTTRAVDFTDGTTVVLEQSAPAIPGKMRAAREVRRVFSPKVRISVPYRDGQYERIFGKEEAK